jgi:hypothetical protein
MVSTRVTLLGNRRSSLRWLDLSRQTVALARRRIPRWDGVEAAPKTRRRLVDCGHAQATIKTLQRIHASRLLLARLELRIQICIHRIVTNHEFLAYLAGAFEHYSGWPHPRVIAIDLRANTPAGQAPWDRQARAIMARMLKKGIIAKVPCRGARRRGRPASGRCGQMHISLTDLGWAQLKTWDELGCRAHTHVGRCHAPESELEFEEEAG